MGVQRCKEDYTCKQVVIHDPLQIQQTNVNCFFTKYSIFSPIHIQYSYDISSAVHIIPLAIILATGLIVYNIYN